MRPIDVLKNWKKREFFIGSLTLMFLMNLGNIINYIFQFSMARLLGPIDYGVLAVLINIIYIFGVPTVSIQSIVSRSTTIYMVKNEYGKIKGIFNYAIRKSLLFGFLMFFIFISISIFLSKYLKIPFLLLSLTGVIIFTSFIYPIGAGLLQGMKRFQVWGWNFVISCLIKLLVSVILVLIGFKVYGAIIGFIFGGIISFLLIIPFIKDILSSKEMKEKTDFFSRQNISALLGILIVVLIYSVDVILVKIIYEPEIAGKYAVASTIGKIILFGTSAIGNAMFPISSERFERGDRSRDIIKNAFLIAIIFCGFIIFLLYFFPELIIKILFGESYMSVADNLLYIGVAFSFISFLNILVLYKVSRDKFRFVHFFILLIFLVLMVSILSIIGNSIEDFSIAFMVSSILIFILSIILIRK